MSLAQAAAAQGVGPDALRKRIPTGQVRARKRAGRWQVWVSAADLDIRIVPDRPEAPDPLSPDIPDAPDRPEYQDGPPSPQMAIEAVRAAGMAQYTRELLEPLYARLEAQAEEIGKLKAELAQERRMRTVRIGNEDAPPAEWPTGRRSWWQRLVWG